MSKIGSVFELDKQHMTHKILRMYAYKYLAIPKWILIFTTECVPRLKTFKNT